MVLVEDPARILEAKVLTSAVSRGETKGICRKSLQMNVGIGETLARYLNEFLHELVILLTTDSALSKAQI